MASLGFQALLTLLTEAAAPVPSLVEEGRLECDSRRMCSHRRGVLGGRAGVSCRLSRISEIQESSITPLQGKERWTSRKFFPGAVFCEGPDLLLYSML